MKKPVFLLALFIGTATLAVAQKYMTKNGNITFSSETPLEKIEAVNRQVNSALNLSTGDFVFKVLIQGFEFPKALMQEHFNENYMESAKFQFSTFSGKVTNIKEVNPAKDGLYKVVVEGDLFIHGVTKKVKVNGTLEAKGGKLLGLATFNVAPKDYDISIPQAVIKNISEAIQVEVKVSLDKLAD